MNPEGKVKIFESESEAKKAGYVIAVKQEDMTAEQLQRLCDDAQPVVLPIDKTSKLAIQLGGYKSKQIEKVERLIQKDRAALSGSWKTGTRRVRIYYRLQRNLEYLKALKEE